MKAMLLAAGKGTRMLPLTATTPKPLLKAGGLSLIEHQILKLKAAGFTELVINHAWLGAQIEQALGNGRQHGVRIAYSAEGEPLETAGGIKQALSLLGEAPFVLVNADIWTDYPFARLHAALQQGDLAHLVLVQNPPHHPQGDFVLQYKRLQLPLADAVSQPSTYTYSGIAVYHPRLFSELPVGKAPLLPLIKHAIDVHAASGEFYAGAWQDIGTPERLQSLDIELRSGAAEQP
jgi:N-acetyl-alpha-D-muramate 1-phosphate uridylyltransferase